jgi:hypothetical protein
MEYLAATAMMRFWEAAASIIFMGEAAMTTLSEWAETIFVVAD